MGRDWFLICFSASRFAIVFLPSPAPSTPPFLQPFPFCSLLSSPPPPSVSHSPLLCIDSLPSLSVYGVVNIGCVSLPVVYLFLPFNFLVCNVCRPICSHSLSCSCIDSRCLPFLCRPCGLCVCLVDKNSQFGQRVLF